MIKRLPGIILFFTLSLPIYCEIVEVPGYNYSIYPLEGWEIEPYESDAELSWTSDRDNVALTVSAWDGEVFNDITTMFNSISPGLNAFGDIVKFNYLNFEGAIGEFGFNRDERSFKGWMIFLNGEDHDFFMMAFTLLENYEECYSEIQSVLDSFSYGKSGQYNPGPISSFLNQSANRTFKNYTVDFFDHPLNVNVSDYDFKSSQSIIEREADIMLNYSLDPENFYNAWKRYYKIIFRDNYVRLDPLFNAIFPYMAGDKYTDYELAELLMFWIQGYTYERTMERKSDLLNLLEASTTKVGDCDARSLIYGILLHKFEIESILLTSEKAKHAFIGINVPGDGYKYTFDGVDYLGVELTAKSLIGEISETISDPALWTPVEMEYINEN